MFYKTIVLFEILIFALNQIQTTDCVFVSVGVYHNRPNHKEFGINQEVCGLRYVPWILQIIKPSKCFMGKPENISLIRPWDDSLYNKVRKRISFGKDAEHGEAPFAVYLETVRDSSTVKLCSGILVHLGWVLTAAHCFDRTADYVEIAAGSMYKIGIDKRLVYTEDWFIHPNNSYIIFNGTHNITKYRSENDVALIKIIRHFPRLNYKSQYLLNPICLPNADDINSEKENATFFGFGRDSDNSEPYRLQSGVALLRQFHRCPNPWKSRFCADTLGNVSKACEGDSGGPLLQYTDNGVRAVLIGVAQSTSPKNCACSKCTFIMWDSVPFHINWILNTILDNSSKN